MKAGQLVNWSTVFNWSTGHARRSCRPVARKKNAKKITRAIEATIGTPARIYTNARTHSRTNSRTKNSHEKLALALLRATHTKNSHDFSHKFSHGKPARKTRKNSGAKNTARISCTARGRRPAQGRRRGRRSAWGRRPA